MSRGTAPIGDTRRRLTVFLLCVALVFALFVARLFTFQGLDASAYAARAEKERLVHVVLHADRGDLLDSAGVPLGTSVDALDLAVDQRTVPDPAATAALLAPVLHQPMDQVVRALTGHRAFQYLARAVTPQTWRAVQALRLDRPCPAHQPALRPCGVYVGATHVLKRVYPNGNLAANLLGFLHADGTGAAGLEQQLNSVLAGKDGSETFEQDAGGRVIPTGVDLETPAVPGLDVQLTIDRDIQWEAQRAIEARVRESHSLNGTVVVMEPSTGRILAMASAPTYDPNHPGASDPSALVNHALADVYEPGSTAKVMTASAAIQEGVVTPASPVTVPPSLTLAGHTFHDDIGHGTWHLTFAGVLARSSNLGTILTYRKLGPAKLWSYLTKFGIGQPTGLGFPGESRGILAPVDQWSGTQGYTIAFGQGFSLNAVQAASVYATIANGGVRVPPRLVDGYRTPDGRFEPVAAQAGTRVVSARTAGEVRDMLEGVVSSEGTAPQAEIAGYRVAGKTGTAQRAVGGTYRGYTASFIGFAPADKPRLVIAVALQDPQGVHFGGMLGGPVFKQVMSFALAKLDVPPTGSQPPHLKISLDSGVS